MRFFIAALLFAFLLLPSAFAAEKESAYERVTRTGTVRCAYVVYPPEVIRDVSTGALSGTVIEGMEAVAKKLDLQIEWEEVVAATMFEGLSSGRHDALCAGPYENPQRAKVGLFTTPFNYGVTYAFSRLDDKRFDKSFSAIGNPDVTVAVLDGEISQSIAEEMFPKAKIYSVPQMAGNSGILDSVTTGKADVAFLAKAPAKVYMDSNPGKIKIIGRDPVRAYPASLIVVGLDEIKLKFLFDATIRTLQLDGTVELILRKYDPSLDSYLLVSKPYERQAP